MPWAPHQGLKIHTLVAGEEKVRLALPRHTGSGRMKGESVSGELPALLRLGSVAPLSF